MAETVTGITVEVKITGTIRGDDGAKQVILINESRSFSDGAGSGKVGQAWLDTSRALNNTSEDLDLAGSLATFNGDTLALTDAKLLFFENLDTGTGNNLIFKQGSSNPVTTILGGTSPTLTIGPSGFALIVNPVDGWAITAGSADAIAMQTNDNMNYRALIVGENT